MFKWTLTKRIWVCFALLTLLISLIVAIVYPFYIKQVLRDNAFDTIIRETYVYGTGNPSISILEGSRQSVGNLFVDQSYRPIYGNMLPTEVLREMGQASSDQQVKLGRYELEYGHRTYYYVVRKDVVFNTDSGYLISFMQDTETIQLMHKLWQQLVYVVLMAGILSLFIAFWLARYLKRPLDILGRRFEEISRLNWKKPFEWKGDDEFERLSSQFEKMRLNLMKYDELQKEFLQQASHELKTPIMIVQSYAQSVKDGIYPKGGLNDSMDVIVREAEQMNNRVKKMLYYTKVDSLRNQPRSLASIRFGTIAGLTRDRLNPQRPEIEVIISGEETVVYAEKEQFSTVLENLLENGLRYAKAHIWLTAEAEDDHVKVIVKNDGPAIEEEELGNLFKPFEKGHKGQFGLGLAIVRRIVEDHGGRIEARNEPDGVAFIMTLPAEPSEKASAGH